MNTDINNPFLPEGSNPDMAGGIARGMVNDIFLSDDPQGEVGKSVPPSLSDIEQPQEAKEPEKKEQDSSIPQDKAERKWGEIRKELKEKTKESEELRADLEKAKKELEKAKEGDLKVPEDYEDLKKAKEDLEEISKKYKEAQESISIENFKKSELYKKEVLDPYYDAQDAIKKIGEKNDQEGLSSDLTDLAFKAASGEVEDYEGALQDIIDSLPIVSQTRAISLFDDLLDCNVKNIELTKRAKEYKKVETEEPKGFNLFMNIPIEIAEQYKVRSDIDSVPELISIIEDSYEARLKESEEEKKKLEDRIKRMSSQRPNATPVSGFTQRKKTETGGYDNVRALVDSCFLTEK